MAESLIMSWAKKYLSLGWSVIPVKPRSKEPLIDWKEFQTRRPTEEELTTWFTNWPDLNIGIVTGSVSNLSVVDADGINGLKYLTAATLTSHVTARTGTGKHLYYRWTEGLRNSASKIADGVDIRGAGGYVVAPCSIHHSGRIYRWERFVPALIPDFPQELLAVTSTALNTAVPILKSENWLSEALEEMKNGHVHNTLVSVLGKFRAHNFSISDTVRLLAPHCIADGKPFEGLEEKVHEIWGRYPANNAYEPNRRALQNQQQGLLVRDYGSLSIKSPKNDNDFEQFSRLNSLVSSDGPATLRTGFVTLDRFLEGGLKSERLFTVAARTGTGKTNFAIALASNLCEQGKKVLFFSTEFQYAKIWARYIGTLGADWIETFRNHSFHVCDSFSPNISQVEEAIKQVMPNVFIFDHINHIGEERESLGAFMQGANFLQRKYNTQGVMVAQLNRQADWVENGKRIEPRMSMIKGSGTIEQSSSRVLLLSETRITPECNEIIGVLDKNDSGDRGLIQFGLMKNPYVFKELI